MRTGQAAMYAAELADPGFDPEYYATLSRGWRQRFFPNRFKPRCPR